MMSVMVLISATRLCLASVGGGTDVLLCGTGVQTTGLALWDWCPDYWGAWAYFVGLVSRLLGCLGSLCGTGVQTTGVGQSECPDHWGP